MFDKAKKVWRGGRFVLLVTFYFVGKEKILIMVIKLIKIEQNFP